MCDICHAKPQFGDMSRQYVLTKGTSEYHGTYSNFRTIEMARVVVCICQSCYKLKLDAANPPASNKRGFFASLAGFFRISPEALKNQLFFSLAREKFSKDYPEEAARAVEPSATTFGSIRYNLETAEAWEERLKANR